ncbi:MAG: hypothetical protein M3Y81_24590 [Chloroflexota bacterium]|nr:hypothetical protein [Chloroflexota bacterium]
MSYLNGGDERQGFPILAESGDARGGQPLAGARGVLASSPLSPAFGGTRREWESSAMMMGVIDIDAAVRYNLPVLMIVINDAAYGAEIYFLEQMGLTSEHLAKVWRLRNV